MDAFVPYAHRYEPEVLLTRPLLAIGTEAPLFDNIPRLASAISKAPAKDLAGIPKEQRERLKNMLSVKTQLYESLRYAPDKGMSPYLREALFQTAMRRCRELSGDAVRFQRLFEQTLPQRGGNRSPMSASFANHHMLHSEFASARHIRFITRDPDIFLEPGSHDLFTSLVSSWLVQPTGLNIDFFLNDAGHAFGYWMRHMVKVVYNRLSRDPSVATCPGKETLERFIYAEHVPDGVRFLEVRDAALFVQPMLIITSRLEQPARGYTIDRSGAALNYVSINTADVDNLTGNILPRFVPAREPALDEVPSGLVPDEAAV